MAGRRRNRWKVVLPTTTLTVIPFVTNLPHASAFFPPLVPPPPVVVVIPPVVPPVSPPPVVVPPVVPPPFVPPPPPHCIVPPVVPPPVVVPPPPGTHTVPEPATVVTALAGLAALAGYSRTRRKNDETETGNEEGK
ncbi:MAG TPA: PEP-CTERM sorting domain-containing protein [Gemmata sp.]|nr:PEP-CTERM sorting domain-containing protein [Gemmata sp.]